MLTIFTVPRPFEGHIDLVQRNGLMSWKKLKGSLQIILLGNEKGVREVCKEYDIDFIPDVKLSSQGTPLVNDIFDKAQDIAQYNIMAFINPDIILFNEFIESAENASKKFENFLLIGQRYDIDMKVKIDFNNPYWERWIRNKVEKEGELHSICGQDYHVFRKDAWRNLPPFIIGRSSYDNWITATAIERKNDVVDCTKFICAVHQEHERKKLKDGRSILEGPERKRNLILVGDMLHQGFTTHANWEMTNKGEIKKRIFEDIK